MAESLTLTFLMSRLAPFVGENMARAAIRAQADKLGVGEIGPEHVESLLLGLGPGLVVFIGREKTRALLDEIRASTPVGKPALRAPTAPEPRASSPSRASDPRASSPSRTSELGGTTPRSRGSK